MNKYLFFISAAFIGLKAFSNSNYSINQKLSFIENKGQLIDDDNNLRPDILYTINTGNGVKAYLTAKGVMYAWIQIEERTQENIEDISSKFKQSENATVNTYHMDMELIGANENPEVEAEEMNESYFNYYLAHCPQGITHVHSFNKIRYQNIYNNIDLIFYLNSENKLEYDFVVKPGGNIADIKFQYKGNVDIKITDNGSLHITNPMGSLTEKTPFTYLQNNNREVASQFQLNDGVVSFKVDKYNENEIIVIDPTLEWGTYFGGSMEENVCGIIGDGNGYLYITGYTTSISGIATSGSYNSTANGSTSNGYRDCFLAKFGSDGTLEWATYYGGESIDDGVSISLYGSSYIYMSGSTASSSGISYGSVYQNSLDGNSFNAFLAKWKSDGTLDWSTYYSPDAAETSTTGRDVYTDPSGNIYMVGDYYNYNSSSSSYELNAFIVKFNSSASLLWYASIGGSEDEICTSVCSDANSNVYMAGYTKSESSIASSGYQNTLSGGYDAFLVKFNQNGTLKWSTYYGGSDDENTNDIKADANNYIYLVGSTSSSSEIASGGFQNSQGSATDGYIVKFSSTGKLKWASYYGGDEDDVINAISIDSKNNLYVAGTTSSSSGMNTSKGYQSMIGGYKDGFIAKINSSGSFQWGSYYGGLNSDFIHDIYANRAGAKINIYAGGDTYSTNGISTSTAYQTTCAGYDDGFIVKFSENNVPISTSFSIAAENNTEIMESDQQEDQAASINNLANFSNQFNIYPNPSSGIVTINAVCNSIISVYDILGNKIADMASNEAVFQLDLSNRKKGSYLIKIQNEEGQYIQKLILQ
jgi:hypothetical protein